MDPNTQQNTANKADSTTPPQGEQIIVGGAFGGTIPATQEAISETMPSFSFDETEFGGPIQPVPTTLSTPQEDPITDPFAGGVTSTNISLDDLGNNITPELTVESMSDENIISDIIDSSVSPAPVSENNENILNFNNTTEEQTNSTTESSVIESIESTPSVNIPSISEATVENSIPEITDNAPMINQSPSIETSDISFDLPSDIPTPINNTPIEEKMIQEDRNKDNTLTDISFDLPATEETKSTTSQIPEVSFDLPSESVQENSLEVDFASLDSTPQTKEITDDFSLPIDDKVKGESESSIPEIVDTEISTENHETDISFDLPSDIPTPINNTPIEEKMIQEDRNKDNTLTDISFDLPTPEETKSTTPQVAEVSFDLPSESTESITQTELPNQQDSQDIAEYQGTSGEDIVLGNENLQTEDTITSINDISVDEDQERDTTNLGDNKNSLEDEVYQEPTEELEIKEEIHEPDTIITNQAQEKWTNTTHELTEVFDEFSSALNTYLSFLNTDTISVVGLRTEDDEVNYTFTKEYDNTISVKKSTTNDLITFFPTESGLEVLLNNESIAYYGVDKVSNDITHYLKEKFGKFTMMITSEYEKQLKAKKDEAKKIKETLRSF